MPLSEAEIDYAAAARILAPRSDYLVLNASSPNTPGLRQLQTPARLRSVIASIRQAQEGPISPPLLVKIDPDLSDQELDDIADLCVELGIDGIIAVNTTVSRAGLLASSASASEFGSGGLSGRPVKDRALEVLRRLYSRVGDELVLISVGGVETPADAWQRILEGASLVQAHTGFVFGGPLWPWRMNRALSSYAREAGFESVQAAVGAAISSHPKVDRTQQKATPHPEPNTPPITVA